MVKRYGNVKKEVLGKLDNDIDELWRLGNDFLR
ncbi:MAG: hypothetical protein RLZZ317_219, partial [Actinomycetota bacterium]